MLFIKNTFVHLLCEPQSMLVRFPSCTLVTLVTQQIYTSYRLGLRSEMSRRLIRTMKEEKNFWYCSRGTQHCDVINLRLRSDLTASRLISTPTPRPPHPPPPPYRTTDLWLLMRFQYTTCDTNCASYFERFELKSIPSCVHIIRKWCNTQSHPHLVPRRVWVHFPVCVCVCVVNCPLVCVLFTSPSWVWCVCVLTTAI